LDWNLRLSLRAADCYDQTDPAEWNLLEELLNGLLGKLVTLTLTVTV
jgi:hypothetical protein